MKLKELRKALNNWCLEIRDVGFLPEGEIHSRSAGTTPYEMGHDDKLYPLERIMAAANWATHKDVDELPDVKKYIDDDDSAVRYWAAVGILNRGAPAVAVSANELKTLMNDASPYAQIAAAYAAANEGVNAKWKTGDGHRQSATCPVVWVDWNEARAFCAWLTKKDQAAGKLKPGQRYRLPTDAEWSVAVGLGKETGNTPMEKRDGIKGIYPWGKEYPAPKGAGNYYGSMRVDSFSWTSPVGSFAANALGIHDLGGNVWEWCEDKMTPTSTLGVMRGASWHNYALGRDSLLSAARNEGLPDKTDNVIGFRIVLEMP